MVSFDVFEQFFARKEKGENFEAQKQEKCGLFTRAIAIAIVTLMSRE